ncbi:hypothetical protein TruAng_008636 [Truncatella angustata]|nr:hypothetical protein TruAng_008636 [Truncatella angustata]
MEEKTDDAPLSPTSGTFESLQSHSNSIRRTRPPNIIVADENRVPLRAELHSGKLAKRESRVGLRSIFGRSKSAKDSDNNDLDIPAPLREHSRSGGIRASIVGNWPYSRSDLSLASPLPPSSSRSTSSAGLQSQPSNTRLRQFSGGKSSPLPAPLHSTPGVWTPSPLFQVYPQAVKHATLPACTASVDMLSKLNANRNSPLLQDDIAADGAGEKKEEKGRRLHQRNGGSRSILDWTTKIYTLVTSGYLLQYAAEGSYDRLPERILRLSKDSAAFASDLIPGRHWVIQIVSYMDGMRSPVTESRSFISKLALRGPEKKSVSTMLLVVESAEEMDNWLAVLRREIEDLGGKKQLTETGEVKKGAAPGELKEKHSQRTIVVRDPERFSTMIQQDFSWSNDQALKENGHEPPGMPPSELSPEFSMDDISTSDSHYSSDGQRLESLRDSRDSNNRLSYISSEQRTFVTSANSSPACSPTRASFSSHPDESKQSRPSHESPAEVRLRPNARDISIRRQSMQTVMSGFDVRSPEGSSRPQSTISTGTDNSDAHHNSSRQSIPNFSKRFPALRPTSSDSTYEEVTAPTPVVVEPEPVAKSSRKPPPTALAMSRPLSTVMDMPTPALPLSPKASQNMGGMQHKQVPTVAPDSHSTASSRTRVGVEPQHRNTLGPVESRVSANRLSSSHITESKTVPRRFVSMTSLRAPIRDSAELATGTPKSVLSGAVAARKAQFEAASNSNQELSRSSSSMGTYRPNRKPSTTSVSKAPSYKRYSFTHAGEPAHQRREMAPSVQKPSLPSSPSNHFLSVDIGAKSLAGRKSMPQLAEGPPLAPPPTRALPPIPQKQ